MLLEGKNAVIYGGAGSVGGAVARAFGREGARVFLCGRTKETLETVAEEIRSAGGSAETAVVDAYLTPLLRAYVRGLRERLGSAELQLMQSSAFDARRRDLAA